MSSYSELKCKFIDDHAYTEDDILIYNIFIYNLPKSANTQKVSSYFQKFGEVLKVGFLGNGKNKNCFINYADAGVAAKVLQKTDHFFLNRSIKLHPCPSWHQPDGQALSALLRGTCTNDAIADIPQDSALILALNDDCLEYICKILPLEDQINFAVTCQRFCEIFKMISHVKYTNLNTDIFSTLTQFQTKIFLQIVGPQVKSLEVDFLYGLYSSYTELTYVKFLGEFCFHVEKLKIVTSNLHISKMRTLIGKMPLLEELELNDVENVNEAMIKSLKTLKNLKFLQLTENGDVTGKNIHLLCGLEKLSLYGCQSLSPWHFKKICQHLKNLKYLDIRCCDLLKTEDFEHMSQHLLKLETLKVSTTLQNFNAIALLPKLKHLEIKDYSNTYVTHEFFQDLAQHQAEQLEELKLVNVIYFSEGMATLVAKLQNLKVLYCDNDAIDDESLKKFSQLKALEELEVPHCKAISDKAVLQILEYCLKLKRLSLLDCISISPDFIRNALKLLQEQRLSCLRSDRLHITLDAHALFAITIAELGLEESSDVLKITLVTKLLNNIPDVDHDDYYDDDDDYYDYPFDDYDYHSGDDYSDEDKILFDDLWHLHYEFNPY